MRKAGKKITDNPNLADASTADSSLGKDEPAPMPDIGKLAESPKQIEENLSTIYFEDQDSEPDMTRLEQAKHSTFKKLLVGALVFLTVLAAISAAGFLYFGRKERGFTGEQVILTIEGPNAAKSGETIAYVVKYRNASDTPLGTASLELRLPAGFTLQESNPTPTDRETWKIGSVPPWGRGEVEIRGVIVAPLDKEQDIQAIVTYRPANFNSEFQKVSTKAVRTVGSELEIGMSAPDKAMPGDKVQITIDYRNNSIIPLENAVVRANLPDEFIPESSVPPAVDEKNVEWRLGKLEASATGTITISGTFASEARGNAKFAAELGYLDKTDNFVRQAETDTGIEVLQGQLVAALVLNGKSATQAVRLGDELRYSVSYRNTGDSSLGNVEIAVVVEAVPSTGLVLWNELDDDLDGALETNRISWTSKQIRKLSRLEAGDDGMISFSVPLAAEPPAGDATAVWSINSWVETFVESIDGDVVNRSTKSQPIVAKVLSDTQIDVTARFYDEAGLSLGAGIIPPEVGKDTTYQMSWRLTNSLHELENLKIKAELPEYVRWNGESKVDAGDLRFDSAEREMVWTLNWLPKTAKEVNVTFYLTITPTETQRDRIPTLMDATVLEATDRAAEATVLLSQAPITTSLEGDPWAAGKGRVR